MNDSPPSDQPPADPAYSLGPLLRLAGHRATAAFSAALGPLGIEGRHFGVLLNLLRNGPLNQRQLGALTGSDKSSIVRTVDQLEEKGLVVRQPAAGDRRAYAVELTERGRALFGRAEQVAVQVNEELLAHLTPDEQNQLRHLLQKFATGGLPHGVGDG